MKKINLFLFAFLGLALAFSSCKKDDNGNNNQNSSTFFAKVDGEDFKPNSVITIKAGNAITITATIYGENEIRLIIPSFVTEDSYEFGNPFVYPVFGYYSESNNNSFDGEAESGTLIISKIDLNTKRIEGTFNFQAVSSNNPSSVRNITEGSFEVNY